MFCCLLLFLSLDGTFPGGSVLFVHKTLFRGVATASWAGAVKEAEFFAEWSETIFAHKTVCFCPVQQAAPFVTVKGCGATGKCAILRSDWDEDNCTCRWSSLGSFFNITRITHRHAHVAFCIFFKVRNMLVIYHVCKWCVFIPNRCAESFFVRSEFSHRPL